MAACRGSMQDVTSLPHILTHSTLISTTFTRTSRNITTTLTYSRFSVGVPRSSEPSCRSSGCRRPDRTDATQHRRSCCTGATLDMGILGHWGRRSGEGLATYMNSFEYFYRLAIPSTSITRAVITVYCIPRKRFVFSI